MYKKIIVFIIILGSCSNAKAQIHFGITEEIVTCNDIIFWTNNFMDPIKFDNSFENLGGDDLPF